MYVEVVTSVRDLTEAEGLARAASAFLLGALSSFELMQRGFMAGDGPDRRGG